MKQIVIPKLQVIAEVALSLTKLAAALDGTDAAVRSTAVAVAESELRRTFDEDELADLIRLVKEARIECRICHDRHRFSRTDLGLCRECARQAAATGA